MRFKKIKAKGDKVHVEYEVENSNGTWDEFSMTSAEKPLSSFEAAISNLEAHVIDMCEFGDNPAITVTGVSFSYGGDNGVMGASIIAIKTLKGSNVGLNIVTPHKASESYSEGKADPKQLLDEDCIKDLEALCIEAEKYVKGNRQQLDLFAKQPAEATA